MALIIGLVLQPSADRTISAARLAFGFVAQARDTTEQDTRVIYSCGVFFTNQM